MSLDLPQGVVNLNAAPWAEVWIDGAASAKRRSAT